MNRCQCVWVAALLGSVSLLSGGRFVARSAAQVPPEPAPASSPAPPPASAPAPGEARASSEQPPYATPAEVPPLSKAVRGAGGALGATQKQEVDAFVGAYVWFLTKGTVTEQRVAREKIVSEPQDRGQADPATTQFRAAYSDALNNQLVSFLKSNPPIRLRVQAAVTVEGVSRKTQSFELQGVTQALLQDESPTVALWGMRAAKQILPAVLAIQGTKSPLLALIGPTAIKHQGPLLMLHDAYETLALAPLELGRLPAKIPGAKTQLQAVVPQVQGILTARIKAYGQSIPPDPLVDSQGTTFLSTIAWSSQTPQQQQLTAQLMLDLLNHTSTAFASPKAPTRDLSELVKRLGQAFKVIGSANSAVVAAADPLTKTIPTTPAAQIANDVAALGLALQASNLLGSASNTPTTRATATTPNTASIITAK